MRRYSSIGLALAGICSLLLAGCAGASPGPAADAPNIVQEAGGFKTPFGIPDIPGFPIYQPPDDKEKDVKNYKRGGTLNFVTLETSQLDMGFQVSCTVNNAVDMMYNKLLRNKVGALANPFEIELEADLAKSWEISADGLTYTFKLNEGVKWQNLPPVNGREFTSEDVRWSFEYYRTGVQADTFENVGKIEAPDKYTVRITLKEANVDFLNSIAAFSFIYPKEIKEQDGNFRQRGVGTGAFIMEKWTPKQVINYVRNPAYFEKDSAGNPLPYLDKVNHFYIPDSGAARAAYRSGQVEFVSAPTVVDAKAILASDPDTVFTSNVRGMVRGCCSNFILFRNDRPPFNDVRVRRALSMGIDRQTMTDTLGGGYFVMAMGMPWTSALDNYPTLKDFGPYYQYNPTEAKRLLAAAGYPNGLTVEMIDQYFRNNAESVIGMLKEIGVTVKRREVDAPTQVSIVVSGEYGNMTAGSHFISAFDVDSEIYPYLHSKGAKNFGRYSDAEMDRLLEAQRREPDPGKRRTILKQIWDRTLDQLPEIAVPSSRSFEGKRPYVKNHRSHAVTGTTSCNAAGNLSRIVWLDK